MNENIEMLEKWLDDPTSVTPEELKANVNSALYAAAAANDALLDDSSNTVIQYTSYVTVSYAASAAFHGSTDIAKKWIRIYYEEIAQESAQEVANCIKKVREWIADITSVSEEELDANAKSAKATGHTFAIAAANCAYAAALTVADPLLAKNHANTAKVWVGRYDKEMKEKNHESDR